MNKDTNERVEIDYKNGAVYNAYLDNLPKCYHMEYYNPYPHAHITFDVVANSFDEAVEKGDAVIKGLRRSATWVDAKKTFNVRRTYGLLDSKKENK